MQVSVGTIGAGIKILQFRQGSYEVKDSVEYSTHGTLLGRVPQGMCHSWNCVKDLSKDGAIDRVGPTLP